MQPGSSQGATVIQVSKNPVTTHTIIQQNGQHLLVSKLGSAPAAAVGGATDAASAASLVTESNSDETVQTLLPAQYLETTPGGEQPGAGGSAASGQV